MIPTAASTPASAPSSASAMIGIASLILEGRALSDDDFDLENSRPNDGIASARMTNSGNNSGGNATAHGYYPQRMESLDPTLQHFQRLRQKLGQLHQSSPGTSRDNLAEQEIVVGPIRNTCNALASGGSTENDNDESELNHFVQRKPKSNHQVSESNLLYTLQSLASTCLRTAPRSFNRNRDMLASEHWFSSSPHSTSVKSFGPPYCNSSSSSVNPNSTCGDSNQSVFVNSKIVKIKHTSRGEKIASPKQGPHCDQFLRKLGLSKGEASEAEEHICDMANLNEICYRWQIHCRQIEVIMSRSDPICIEVYLGPENHEILLEQWIIQKGEKSVTPNMTLQSLCNAIRSQLYFSQITAWCDLLRKANPFDKDVQENVRIKTVSRDGFMRKPRLDIFYRIKAYDSTACFNSKPNVHNFPNVVIAENCSVSVCLKSLPRLQGGIPKIGDYLGPHAAASCSTISMASDSGEQQASSREETMMLDDRLNLPCKEKGKHKCAFDEEEGSSDAVGESNCSSGMSHREKQLMKYRKRMMKRDKKTKKAMEAIQMDSCQPMQLEEKHALDDSMHSYSDSGSPQSMHEFGSINSINSIRPPLYQTTTSIAEAVQTNTIEMVSIGTQTPSFPMIYPSCENCGYEMQFICWNCEKKAKNEQSPCQNGVHTPEPPKLGKGDILLQAIQRTPQRKNQDLKNNNNSLDFRPLSNSNLSDCQLCKRQKTGHHYNSGENGVVNGEKENGVTNGVSHEYQKNTMKFPSNKNRLFTNFQSLSSNNAQMEQKLESKNMPLNGKCDCTQPLVIHLEEPYTKSSHNGTVENGKCVPSPTNSIDLSFTNDISAQFKTPKAHLSPKNQLKPSILNLSSVEENAKSLPEVNLSNVFCNSSSPIPITPSEAFTFDDVSPEIPVQKSNSAPTLPNSPSLSPRFLKQAAIYKRRSRHLSDRSSERSSFGSDEQLSDEDLDSVYSPASSPIKIRTFLRCNIFGRKPLLGNLEESLLQRRFTPKTQVAGFKVLLGASGGFCPTQLTIPAAAYFYELTGKTLNTPYVCEIRLSRKGYTIPRTGTVQATLLNPLGTVVRMFVVPYDFRDMPPMSQTFIRQRILAIDSEAESTKTFIENNQHASTSSSSQHEMSFSDQMRSLRYSIHLRFQTSRSGRLALHTDIRFLISRRTDCDTAAAHAKGALESPNDLQIVTIIPEHPKYSARQENPNKIYSFRMRFNQFFNAEDNSEQSEISVK